MSPESNNAKISALLIATAHECIARGLTASVSWASSLALELSRVSGVSALGSPSIQMAVEHTAAVSFVQLRQYSSAVSALSNPKNNAELFLHTYAAMLDFERADYDRSMESMSTEELRRREDVSLQFFAAHLENVTGDQCPYLLLMQSMLLERLGNASAAISKVCASIQLNPTCFASWEQLSRALSASSDPAAYTATLLPLGGQMAKLLRLYLLSTLGILITDDCANYSCAPTESIRTVQSFLGTDTASQMDVLCCTSFGMLCAARVYFSLRQYDLASDLVKQIHAQYPDRVLCGADVLSDVLFLDNDRESLIALAGRCVEHDKFAPETCYVLGNLHAALRDSERAAMHFRRAVRLNSRWAGAWMLLGQQFIELRQPEAAIDAYTRATEVAPHDYRGWMGLGQVYDLADLPQLALEHLSRACNTGAGRFDPRVHEFLGDCHVDMWHHEQALAAYINAESAWAARADISGVNAFHVDILRAISSRHCGSVCLKISRLYRQIAESADGPEPEAEARAENYMTKYIQHMIGDEKVVPAEVPCTDNDVCTAVCRVACLPDVIENSHWRSRMRQLLMHAASANSELSQSPDFEAALAALK